MLARKSSTVPIQKMSHQDSISRVLLNNRYALQKIIGRGGIGITYLAHDSYKFNEVCVIKEFAPFHHNNKQFNKLQDLFIREAKILYQLKHPQIPQFHACFKTKEKLFLVQEYIQGKSYSQLLKQRRKQGKTFSESEIILWLKNMLPVLDYIHQNGIIHRDISPDNIMQPQDGELPMLIDFGVGKLYDSSAQEVTDHAEKQSHQQTLVGKIGYASHEQIQLGQCFPCSDLYSLGVTAIVLLTGKQPNQLINYSLQWQWRNYVQVSDAFAQIIDRLIAYNPTYRYQSAPEALLALKSLTTNISQSTTQNSAADIKPNQKNTNKTYSTQTIVETKLLDIANNSHTVTAEFINYCQKELAYCIGPIATLVIEETLVDSSGLPKEKFIEAIAANIPYWQQRKEFCQKFAV